MHSIYMECKPAPICWCFVVSFKHSNKCFKQVVMQFFLLLLYFSFSTIAIAMHAIRNQLKLWFLLPRKFRNLPSVKDLPHLNCVQGTMAKVQLARMISTIFYRTSHKKTCQKFSYYLIN